MNACKSRRATARRFGAPLVCLAVCLPATSVAQEASANVTQFLTEHVGLKPLEVAAVERGETVVRALDTSDKRDIAIFGIVAVDMPRDAYLQRLADFPHSLRRPTQTQFGLFGTPAATADIETLTIDRQDLAKARTCGPGNCVFKLPAVSMKRLRDSIDWSAADPGLQADALMRRRLVEYVNDYQARGDSAMVVYDDRGRVRASDAFDALLAQSPYVYRADSSVYQYLARYPRARLDGVHEAVFWSVDSLQGLRPILMVNHVVVYTPPGASFSLAAQKQIYANHYFEAALDLVAIVDRPRADGTSGVYLVRLGRYRFDNMPSSPLVNVRGKAVRRFRDQIRAELDQAKTSAEPAQ